MVPEVTPEVVPEATPEVVPKVVPEKTPEQPPEVTPEKTLNDAVRSITPAMYKTDRVTTRRSAPGAVDAHGDTINVSNEVKTTVALMQDILAARGNAAAVENGGNRRKALNSGNGEKMEIRVNA